MSGGNPMQITQPSLTQLCVTWPRYPRATHQEIVRRLKLISGATFDKEHACWFVPAWQGDKLMDSFPRAAYSVDAVWACTDAHSKRTATFYDALVSLGVRFVFDAHGAICAVGKGISPLLQELVDVRADALRPLVLRDQAKARKVATLARDTDERLAVIGRGIQNAAAKAQRDAVRRPRWKRKKGTNDMVQKGLGL